MNELRENPFVASLERLYRENDRAALAKLRRGLGKKGGTPEMYRYVVPYLPRETKPSVIERYFLIASLFASHPEPAHRSASIGKSFRTMKQESPSVEKRFETLLSANIEDIGGHLRQAVSLAKSKNVPIDFHRLFEDLGKWHYSDRRVQRQWALDFWGYEKENTETETDLKGETK